MAPKPKRGRSERRSAERALRKEVNVRQRLVASAPGGAADRPLTVSSVAVVDGRARSEPCVHCGGELDLRSHQAQGPTLRLVTLICRLCHAPRSIWFRIESTLAN
ncbi:MAG TPA: hypothetical protein VGG33_00950 [Polyangia bacterium]